MIDISEPLVSDLIKVDALTNDDISAFEYIRSHVETAICNIKGLMFDVRLSIGMISLQVVAEIKRQYEAAGWAIGVFPDTKDGVVVGVQLVFAKSRGSIDSTALNVVNIDTRTEAPRLVKTSNGQRSIQAPRLSRELLLRMPTRSRPEQVLSVLSEYRRLASGTVNMDIEVIIDEDDTSMNNSQILQKLYDLDCFICADRHRSKIEAVNGGRQDDWQIMALISDDMVPIVEGYDRRIVDEMRKRFPLLDGAIYFNDGYNKDNVRSDKLVLCTLPIFGRHLYDQFGYVYYPGYGSIYCDDEQTEILTAMRRLEFVDEILIEHRHHAAGKAAYDSLYKGNDERHGGVDVALLHTRSNSVREHGQFTFDAPPLWLSILICSTVNRSKMMNKLVEYLRWQCRQHPREVEICVSVDAGEKSIGEKRQHLLERAVGKFVAFVDDDDWVDSLYVDRVLSAVKSQPDADCASLHGVYTVDGKQPESFVHSIVCSKWETIDYVHYRYPNHLNAIRLEHALKAGFPSKNFGEDHDFSNRVRSLLNVEISTGDKPLYYYWFLKKAGVGALPQNKLTSVTHIK